MHLQPEKTIICLVGWWLCHRQQEMPFKVLEMPITSAKVHHEFSCLNRGCEHNDLASLRNKKPPPQCSSDPSLLGGTILLFACGFQGMWLQCSCCPRQRWATQMASGHQAGFSPPNKGGNRGHVDSLLLCLYPDGL